MTAALTVVLAIHLGTAGPARAATEKETELNARQAFAAARYDEAIELFARLYAETLNPIYLRNIGRCHQKKREPDKAIDAFRDYLTKGKSVSSAERREIQGYIKEMERLRDDQARDKEKERATAFTPAPPAAPAPAATPPPTPVVATTTINVAPATAPDATAGGPVLVGHPEAPPEEHPPVYKRWWFWTAIGVVVAGGVAAALLIPGPITKPPCTFPGATPGDCK